MTNDQFDLLISKLDMIVYLLQVLLIASCFLCGFVSMQLIIHSKNQKHLL